MLSFYLQPANCHLHNVGVVLYNLFSSHPIDLDDAQRTLIRSKLSYTRLKSHFRPNQFEKLAMKMIAAPKPIMITPNKLIIQQLNCRSFKKEKGELENIAHNYDIIIINEIWGKPKHDDTLNKNLARTKNIHLI